MKDLKAIELFKPKKKWYRHWSKRAAVAIIVSDEQQLLMIKRAEFEGDPWSGQMAFPGGRVDPIDASSLAAASRETLEEIGLNTDDHTRLLGRLSDIKARPQVGRKPLVISPYIFRLQSLPELTLNYEVAEVVWVPLAFLLDRNNRTTMTWQRDGISRELPCYRYKERVIWGLSLMMIDELLEVLQ